jgi:hypothetical protein
MSEIVTEVVTCESSTTDYSESEIYVKDKVSAMVKDYFDNPEAVSEEAITRHSHYAIKLADGKDVENLIEYIIEVAYFNLLRSYQGDLSPANLEALNKNLDIIDKSPLIDECKNNNIYVYARKMKF